MRIFVFFVILFKFAYGLDYVILEEEYGFRDNKVYSSHLFKDIEKDFMLFEIPKNSHTFRIKSSQLISKFEEEGIQVGAKGPIVVFKKESSGDIDGIKRYVASLFLQEYRKNNIQIKEIILEQMTPFDFERDWIKEIDFNKRLLKRNEGTFDVLMQEGDERRKKIFFKYYVDATLDVVQTISPISGGETISYNNAKVVTIPFDKVSSSLMEASQLGNIAARSYTPSDVIVTEDRLVPKIVVRKGDKVIVAIKENGVLLEFLLEAQKNAAIGDVIKAKVDKKTYQIRIISEGRGELI